jgi:hypothetical protein
VINGEILESGRGGSKPPLYFVNRVTVFGLWFVRKSLIRSGKIAWTKKRKLFIFGREKILRSSKGFESNIQFVPPFQKANNYKEEME